MIQATAIHFFIGKVQHMQNDFITGPLGKFQFLIGKVQPSILEDTIITKKKKVSIPYR